MDGGTLRGLVCMIIGAAIVASASPSRAAGATGWSVQTSSDIVLFVQGDVDASVPLALIEQSLSEIVDYWGIDMDTIERGGDEPWPLCSLSLYLDWELMAREWNSYDAAGMELECGFGASMATSIPEPGPCGPSGLVAIASGYPAGSWLPIAVHELTHVLQDVSWHLGSNTTPSVRELLLEGVAEWSEYALGAGSFQVEVQEPVALWLQEGGSVDSVPGYLTYQVGASLVERCVRLEGPRELWRLCSDTKAVPLGVAGPLWHGPIDFVVVFLEAFGVNWATFLRDWAAETHLIAVRPGTDLRLRWMRDALWLRRNLLSPLLRGETLADLDRIRRSVADFTATAADLDRAEVLLRRAPETGARIDVDALTAREGTLKRHALRAHGSRSDVMNVLRLGMLVRGGTGTPWDFAAAFANAVNDYVPAGARR